MRDVGQTAEFALEAKELLGVSAQQCLQRDDLVADTVVHLVDQAHAAGAELAPQCVPVGPAKRGTRSNVSEGRLFCRAFNR
jgi:hypothetical protein